MKSLDKLAKLLEDGSEKYIQQGWFTTRQAAEKFKMSKDTAKCKLNRLHQVGKVQKKLFNNGKLSLWFVP
jgi:predicted transcriptional regulator